VGGRIAQTSLIMNFFIRFFAYSLLTPSNHSPVMGSAGKSKKSREHITPGMELGQIAIKLAWKRNGRKEGNLPNKKLLSNFN
jgi:hypothetical protein